jgi:hypothetical protein
MSINSLKDLISNSNRTSARDRTLVQGTDDIPWSTSNKSVVLALLRLCEGGYLKLPCTFGRDRLARFIMGRYCALLSKRCIPGGVVYPVISLENNDLSFGHSRR